MKRIAVLTSGGDAPGMNAAIRAVVRVGLEKGLAVFGVRQGYEGLITGDFQGLGARDVGGIIQRGGTVLGSARCLDFQTPEGRRRAIYQMRQRDIAGLVVIGGNGSQSGAHALSEMGFPVVGIASTIDNDLPGSDVTIGVDSALSVALEAIDRLKVTASSHRRAFLVEVMGRNCGYLAAVTAIAGGAEAVVLPEDERTPEMVADDIHTAYRRGKEHAIVVVAEGARYNASALLAYFKEHHQRLGFSVRATILGHVQRGGTPSAFDRLLATRLGVAAVEALTDEQHGILLGLRQGVIAATPLAQVVSETKKIDPKLAAMARMLSL